MKIKQFYTGKAIGFVVMLAILLVVFAVLKFQSSTPVELAATKVDKVALAQLQSDLKNISPHFIDSSKAYEQTLTPLDQKIKDDIVALFTAGMPDSKNYYSGLWLNAVGKRYILASQLSGGSSFDEIIDSRTGKAIPIPGWRVNSPVLEGGSIELYINYQAIYTYALDQSEAVLVPGSQLSGEETYHAGTSDFQLAPEQTHTKNSITISVFDSSQLVQNPDAQPNAMQTMNKRVRKIILPLPQGYTNEQLWKTISATDNYTISIDYPQNLSAEYMGSEGRIIFYEGPIENNKMLRSHIMLLTNTKLEHHPDGVEGMKFENLPDGHTYAGATVYEGDKCVDFIFLILMKLQQSALSTVLNF